MAKLSSSMIGKATKESKYRRLQRFMDQVSWSDTNLSKYLLDISGLSGPLTLLIDRTNWQYGSSNINYLVISALGPGYSIPLKWMTLDKKGNSLQGERISLLEELIEDIGVDRIGCIVGDREFVGEQWVNWLINRKIGFNLRIKANMYVVDKGRRIKVHSLVKRKSRKRPLRNRKVQAQNAEVYLHGHRIITDKGKSEELIIITDKPTPEALQQYGNRWYIENMFKNMKTNGFNLAETHITNLDRLETLFGLVSIAITWMTRVGEWLKEKEPKLFKILKHNRLNKSVFRAGIDEFIRCIYNDNNRKIWIYFRFLSCT